MKNIKVLFSVFAMSLALFSCDKDDDNVTTDKTDDVLQIVVRQVPDENAWYSKLVPFVNTLKQNKSYVDSREFKSIFSVAPFNSSTGQPYDKVYFGLNQFESQSEFNTLFQQFMTNPPQSFLDLLPTFTDIMPNDANVVVKKFRNTPNIDVKNFLSTGQVLEIAIRDVSGYADFNDFDTKRAAFVNLIKQQDGFVKELEYRSEDGKYYVGMTIYENAQKFQAIATNPAVMQSTVAGALFSSYPPDVSQMGIAYPQN